MKTLTYLNCCGEAFERTVHWQVHLLVEYATPTDDCFGKCSDAVDVLCTR